MYKIKVKRAYLSENGTEMAIISCPFCPKNHIHGNTTGHRVAHCANGTLESKEGYYVIARPITEEEKLMSACQNAWDKKGPRARIARFVYNNKKYYSKLTQFRIMIYNENDIGIISYFHDLFSND